MNTPAICLTKHDLGNARKAFDAKVAEVKRIDESNAKDSHVTAARIMLDAALSERKAIVESINAQAKSGNFNVDWGVFSNSIGEIDGRTPFTKIDDLENSNNNESLTANEGNYEQSESTAIGTSGNPALDGTPTANDATTQKRGSIRGGSVGGGAKDTGRSSGTRKSGDSSRKRVGNGTGDLFVSDGGSGSDTGSGAIATIPNRTGNSEDAQRDLAPVVGAVDYRISSLTKLGEGGQRAKYNDNVAAIRLMRSLQEEGRTATPEEQHVLARYVGWGGIPQAFDPNNKDWSKQYDELNTLLSPDEREAAIESTQYAHYTSEGVINGIYSALKHLGFSGGKILEPGSGVGNFIGLMPDAMRNQSRFTGVEREKIAGGIAKLLYPNQNIQQQDFTYFNANDEYFDAVIGNPPFAATGLVDMTGRKHLSGLSVHNYFFAKSIDMLRENGVLAMVVTSSFMDAKKDRARSYIAERASLIGAIRLPNSAFMGNAGTDVTTDIIFLKKRPESEWGSKAAKEDAKRWLEVATVPDPLGGAEIPLNQYFVTNPNMMIGRMERVGGRYREDMPGLVAPKGIDVKAEMEQRIKNLPENVYVSSAQAKTKSMTDAAVTAMSNIDAAVGGYFTRDGVLYQRLPDIAGEQMASTITPDTKWTEKTALGEKKFKKLFAASEIRRTLRQLIVAESKNSSEMTPLREQLSVQYDAFVKDHGYFNDRASIQLLADDPDYPLLMSLENAYDPGITDTAAKKQGIKAVKPSAKKSAIFTKSILGFREAVTKADSPVDALMISIAERGRIDPQFIGELLGRDGSAVLSELSQGLNPELFIDPAGNGYVLKDEYLSGNVRKKLAQAKNAGLDVNARALEAVLPADIPSHEIQGKLGAPWIPTETYEGFISHLLGDSARASVAYVKALNVFNVNVSGASEVANTNTYGTQRKSAVEILTSLLNNKEIKVGYTDEDGKWHLLKTETDEALDKAAIIREKFGDWLMSDPDRSEALTREYNDKMNNYVVRKFDGSILSFPGKVSDLIIKFRRHQRNAISRIIQEGRGLLDHVVGAGKTFTVIGAAMELKRTGLAKKSMIVVPNHLVKQWATDFYRLYPGANILTATKKDFEKANRRKFLAKIATGDWDAVIIAHSSFGFIKPDPVFEEKFNNERIKEVMDAIKEMGDPKSADSASKRTIKQLAKMKENLEQKIKSLRDKPMDDLLDLGQLGVDQIFVDEAHLFKNLMFTTKMQNVRGLGQPEGSQRAYDMFIKTRQITEANGGTRGVVFATGTPVSNSLAEMYHMMRYLMPESLMDMGHATFDAWANTFADVEQVWMQAMSGDGYKSTNRMTKFVNTPDLLKAFNQVADTVTIEDIKDAYREENEGKEFPIPALKGGRRTPVSLIRTKEQSDYMEEIAARAKELENNKGKPEKGKDNMLSILGDARKAAMDIRLVNPAVATRDPNSRIATVARNVFDTYQKFNDVLGTQLIFSDMGTPKKTAAKELDEYNELMAKIAPLSDPDTLASADLGDENAIELLEKAEEAQAKMDSYGKDWLDGIKSALNGFSIYDDTKAALVEMGIPENEIAFIHDYNTDEQKAALFRAVNDGKIRVLMGSTPKMGAGTNVQDRLVELHHMDVPWKPSDIEQREGRIVRQGNKLLEIIGKDFEVSIKAYATQDTLDLFMWQVQEKKLAMINQLRTGQVGREMDDAFEELQMSAGEMQAAATSNPYLLEEIQLKDKVKKLERKKKSFEGQRNDLINRNRNAQAMVNRIPNELAIAKKILPFDQAYADLLKNRPFKMTINSDVFTDEAAAAERLRELTTIEETEEEKAANAAFDAAGVERQSRKKIDPIDINGRSYKSKAAVAEAFRFIAGDADKITFSRNDETVIRRADIEKIIREDVQNAAETDDTVYIGNLGGFEFSVTGDHTKTGEVRLIVTAKAGGVDLPFDMETKAFADSVEAANSGVRDVISLMTRQIGRMENIIYYLEQDLSKATRTLDELKKTSVSDKWDGEEELRKAREDHKAVLKKINEAGTELAKKNKFLNPLQKVDGSFARQSPVLYAQTNATISPENQLSEEALYALADSALSSLENAPPVVVLDSAKLLESRAVGIESIPMSSGAMHNGTIYLFRDGIRDRGVALATVWHELFHYGLRKLMTPEMYISNLNKLYNSDENIRTLAENWKESEDASLRQKNGISVTDMHLLSIEEALAMTAEDLKLGGNEFIGSKYSLPRVRKLLSWMADVAKSMGLNRISQALRTMSLSDGEKFVKSIFKKMEDGATMSQQSMADLDTRSINYSSGNSQNQKSLSQYRNESEFIDRWENDLGQPIFYGKKYDLSPIKTFNTESDFEADSLQLGQSHTVKPGNKVHGFAIKSKDGKNLGTAILQVDNYGDIVGIHDIEIKVKNQGVGTEVVRNIVASTKSDVAVIQIVPSAQKFWKEVGVYEQDQYDNGAFNFEAFAKSIRGSAGRASQELAKDSQGRPEDGSGNEAQERGIEATGDNLTYKAPVVSPYFKDKYFFGMELDELKAYASELTKGWNNPPKITVVDVASELPFEAASHAQGIYYKGQVYLVAMNIRSEEQAQFVLMHEVLGHSGLRGAFGNQLNGKLIALASRNKDIASAAKQWRDENQWQKKDRTESDFIALSIEEVLADIAGSDIQIKGFDAFIAAIQNLLRSMNLNALANWLEDRTNAEVLSMLATAKKHIAEGANDRTVAATFAHAYSSDKQALTYDDVLGEIASIGEAFAFKPSTGDTMESIVADVDPSINVRKITNIPGETRYELKLPDETMARIMVRPFNKYGNSIYGFDMDENNEMTNQVTERPGRDAEEAYGKDDVWIDVSLLNEGGGFGAKIYHIAANYAHNTGKVFIGDPAGVTHAAMLRRPEQMLSSALKFGTTEHLAPHPAQIRGNAKNGIAPLDWVYGDHVGNIQKLIDLTVKNIDNAGGIGGIEYDGRSGEFIDSTGSRITREDLRGLAEVGLARAAQAGGTTLARYAFTSASLQSLRAESARPGADRLLVRLRQQLRDHVSAVDQNGSLDSDGKREAKRLFYSAGSPSSLTASLIDSINNAKNVKLPANYLVSDLFDRSGQIGWWDKTVGTPYNLAKRNPLFANVYNRIQSFIGDVSMFTAEAADLAPTILPKLEKLADLKKMPLTAEDTKAISAAIFEGTLSWARDDNGRAVKVKDLDEANELRVTKENEAIAKRNTVKQDRFKDFSTEEKKFALISGNHVQESVMKMWLGLPVDQFEKIIDNKFDKDVVALEEELAFEEAKAGVVWSDSELRDIFNLNDKQIGLYKEFRAAINKSLTNLAITDMVKMIGKDYRHLMAPAIEKGSVTDASEFLREYFLDLAATDEENQVAHFDTVNMVMKKAEKANDLMDRGYAPLSRFGKHTVYVEEAGEQVYFGLYESKMEAAKAARNMRADYPNATVTSGTMSEEAYKLFAGVSIETVELFGDMLGLSDPDTSDATREAYQAYLKMAKNNRSSMKRLINRKGIAGFSEDAGRVLANFVYSNGRMTSANIHMGELDEAVNAIPKVQGELKDAAVQLSEHVKNPENAGTKLGGLMFAQYLGGSVASAMVNLTQPLMMTMPYLSQFGGLKSASAELIAAARVFYKQTTGDATLDAALKLAEEEGIVSPQEVHHIQAQAAGNGSLQAGDGTLFGDTKATVNNGMQKIMLGWGKLFALAEQTNRRITFIAAYRTAVAQNIANPAKFAEEAIAATQGTYNSGNKPKWARNTLGSLAMTFKQYSIAYVELLNRMWNAGEPGSSERAAGRRGALYMLAVLFLMSGADGLPFEQDLEDLIDTILQKMGYNFSIKRAKEKFFAKILGDGGAAFALKGLSGISGVPIDLAARLSMGNLIPATGLFKNKESHVRDVAELAGAPGDFVVRSYNALSNATSGNFKGAIEEFAPRAVSNAMKGAEMINSGQATDTRGYKINDVSTLEGAMKIIGFQPNSTAHVQDDKNQALDLMSQARAYSSKVQEHWAQGLAKNDPEMVQEARDMRDSWNAKNPETPIRANMPAIIKRVRNMRMDAKQRTESTAPKAMRTAVREELAS